jgi:hypothetical protein
MELARDYIQWRLQLYQCQAFGFSYHSVSLFTLRPVYVNVSVELSRKCCQMFQS